MAIPSKGFAQVLQQALPFMSPKQILVSTTKGFEEKGFKLMSQILQETTGFQHLGILSGPNLASEVAKKFLTATVIASPDDLTRITVQQVLGNHYFRVYANTDMYGAELGGALKNISIGLASGYGKAVIHGAGDPEKIWTADHDSFLESMAEASKTIIDYRKDKIAFINVVANLSVDCDCCAKAEDPCMKDIGILASDDPVALDQACIDLIYNSNDEGKDHFIERIESRNGIHTIEAAYALGFGNRDYELINIDVEE